MSDRTEIDYIIIGALVAARDYLNDWPERSVTLILNNGVQLAVNEIEYTRDHYEVTAYTGFSMMVMTINSVVTVILNGSEIIRKNKYDHLRKIMAETLRDSFDEKQRTIFFNNYHVDETHRNDQFTTFLIENILRDVFYIGREYGFVMKQAEFYLGFVVDFANLQLSARHVDYKILKWLDDYHNMASPILSV